MMGPSDRLAATSAADGIAIRQLGPADLPLMRNLSAMFGAVFEEPETYGGAPPDDAYLERLLGAEHFVALVATRGDAVVGGLVAYVLDKFEQQRREIYIYDLGVVATHRRKGIASALIEQLRAIARALGAYVVFVQADRGDAPAIALYSKLGRREDVLHFDIAVEGEEG